MLTNFVKWTRFSVIMRQINRNEHRDYGNQDQVAIQRMGDKVREREYATRMAFGLNEKIKFIYGSTWKDRAHRTPHTKIVYTQSWSQLFHSI